MTLIRAQYDGNSFIPEDIVHLPVGTPVEVYIPQPVRSLTTDESEEWDEIVRDLAASEPAFPTVEEALDHTRGRK